MSPERPWADRAACLGKGHLVVTREDEPVAARHVREDAGRALCAVCPVIEDCRADGDEHPEDYRFAICAGLWPRERGISTRIKRISPYKPQGGKREHDTNKGYQQHKRAGETPCDACREAHARDTAARRQALYGKGRAS